LDQAQRSRRTGHSGSKTKELIGESNFSCRLMLPLDAITAADHFDDQAFAHEDAARRNAPFFAYTEHFPDEARLFAVAAPIWRRQWLITPN
jgi:hypothetical protein